MQVLHSFVARLKLLCDLDVAMVDKLQDHEDRLSALEKSHEKNKKLTEGNATRIGEIQMLVGRRRVDENK